MTTAAVEVRRAGQRFRTDEPGIGAWHCFSYAGHYDPANTHFGVLTAHNDFTLQPGAGFTAHKHSEIEAVTWLLDGALRHSDDAHHGAVLTSGQAQRMSAGSGIEHAEVNDADVPTRFVQMWVRPDTPGRTPAYEQHDFTADLASGDLIAVASGAPDCDAPLRIGQRAATLYVAQPTAGQRITLPVATYLDLYVARGEIALDGQPLGEGDEVRSQSGRRHEVTATTAAELLVWGMHGPA